MFSVVVNSIVQSLVDLLQPLARDVRHPGGQRDVERRDEGQREERDARGEIEQRKGEEHDGEYGGYQHDREPLLRVPVHGRCMEWAG